VRLAGRVPVFPGPGALLAGGVEGLLGCGEPVIGGVVLGLRARFISAWALASVSSAAASLRRASASWRIASRRSRAASAT